MIEPASQPLRRPSRRLYRAEPARALAEMIRFRAAFPALAGPLGGPPGDGRTVLVLPGFMAGDESTRLLRRLLRARGYDALPWALGRNLGPTPRVLSSLDPLLRSVAADSGRPVSLIGWSLGGIYARGLAARHPELVRDVIVMGSPLRVSAMPDNHRLTNAGALYHRLRYLHGSEDWLPPAVVHNPPPVPSTSIYSLTDGIVPWQACLEFDGEATESIAVHSSHCGMGHNVLTMPVILDRLAQPEGRWRPYTDGARSTSRVAG